MTNKTSFAMHLTMQPYFTYSHLLHTLLTTFLLFTPPCTATRAHASRNYDYFIGKPRWARANLTYALSPNHMIASPNLKDIRHVLSRAFSRWASVVPLSFTETKEYDLADIKIGFYRGDHGDGEPFDGVLGVLAHSFSPESGRFHLDGDETWAVNFRTEKSSVAVDLESVCVHEIGHLLGLAHSNVEEAVMYSDLKPRMRKVDLSFDDIKGIQALYGSNPNFTFKSLVEFDISSNQAANSLMVTPLYKLATLVMVLVVCLCM